MCKDPKDTKPTSQNTIEPNFKITKSLLSLSFSYNPPPSFHFSMIRGENFANSIANRMSVMPPWLDPRGTCPTIFIFKTLVVSIAATVALAEIGAVRPCRTSPHRECTAVAVAIAVCLCRHSLTSLSLSSSPAAAAFTTSSQGSHCSRAISSSSAPPSGYFLPRGLVQI